MLAIGVPAFLIRVNRTPWAIAFGAMQVQGEFNTKGRRPCFREEGVRFAADNRAAKAIADAISSISNLLFFNVYFTAGIHGNPYYAYNLRLGKYFSLRYATFSMRTCKPLMLLPVPVSALERIL